MKFAEGLASSLGSCLCLSAPISLSLSSSSAPSFHLPPLPPPPDPSSPHPHSPRCCSFASSSSFSPLAPSLPPGIASLPDPPRVIFAQNRFNSNLGIRLFLLYVSAIPPPPLPLRRIMYTRAQVWLWSRILAVCTYVCMYIRTRIYARMCVCVYAHAFSSPQTA